MPKQQEVKQLSPECPDTIWNWSRKKIHNFLNYKKKEEEEKGGGTQSCNTELQDFVIIINLNESNYDFLQLSVELILLYLMGITEHFKVLSSSFLLLRCCTEL